MQTKKLETHLFHVIWWTLAVLLPDLIGFATRDWRAAIAGAGMSGVMILLSLRTSGRVADGAMS